MAEPVNDVPVVAEAESKAAAEVKAAPAVQVAPSGVSAAMEHMKAAAAALIPGAAGGQAEGAEPGMDSKLKEAKDIVHEAANDVKGAMGKLGGLFGK
jgi:hypothetical protein